MIRFKLSPDAVLHLDDRDYTITSVREGGSAVVYGAVSPSSNEQYVIKEIYPYSGYNPISATRDPKTNRLIVQDTESKRVYDEAVARFQNEIALLAEAGAETFQVAAPFRVALDNPGYGVATSFPKDLQSLENWINGPENKSFSSDLDRIIYAIKAVRSLLSGLSAIHDKGILHLDISTGNLFIGKTADHPVVFFLDFGCAVKFTRGVPVRIDHHMTTQAFAAPERMISKTPKDLFEATDLFSVAMILFHMIIRFSAACPNGIIKELPFKLLSNDCLRSENYIRNLAIPGPVKNTLLQFFRDMFKLKPLDRVFQTAEAMNERLSVILEICTGKGAHPECVALSNRKKLEAMLSRTGLLPDLLSPTYRTITLTQNTLLLGDGGTGKTTLMLAKWRDLLDEYDNGGNKQIPVWISLSSADGTTNYIRRQIARYIELDGANDGEYINKVEELLQKHTFTIFLDGINEARNVGEIITELTNMQKGCFDNCTIIVSSRTDYSGPFWNSFERVSVAPLDADAVQHVLKERTVDYRSLPERLQKTLLRPMFLVLYLKLVKDKTLFDALDEVNTPGEILYAHITRLANLMILADAGKKDLVEYAVWYLLPRLAFYGKMYMSYQEADELVVRCSEELAQSNTRYRKLAKKMAHDTSDEDIIEDILIPMGIIAASDEGYAFSHENYYDFFIAFHVKQEMAAAPCGTIPPCLMDARIPFEGRYSPLVELFLGDLWGEYRFELKDSTESGQSPIESWLQTHATKTSDDRSQIAIMRIIEVMKAARHNWVIGDYSDLDLTASNFYDCKLPGSDFQGAIIDNETFIADGHIMDIEAVRFLDDRYLITADAISNIFVWDLLTQKRCFEYELENDLTKALYYVDSTRFVVVGYDGAVYLYTLFNKTPRTLFPGMKQSGFARSSANSQYIKSSKQVIVSRPEVGLAIIEIESGSVLSLNINDAPKDVAEVLRRPIVFLDFYSDKELLGCTDNGTVFSVDTVIMSVHARCDITESHHQLALHSINEDVLKGEYPIDFFGQRFYQGLYNPDKNELVIGATGEIIILNCKSFQVKKTIPIRTSDDIASMFWQNDLRKSIILACYKGLYSVDLANEKTIKLLSIKEPRKEESTDLLLCADYSPATGVLAMGTFMTKALFLWDFNTQVELWRREKSFARETTYGQWNEKMNYWINYNGTQIARVFNDHLVLMDLEKQTINSNSRGVVADFIRNAPDNLSLPAFVAGTAVNVGNYLPSDYGIIDIFLLDKPAESLSVRGRGQATDKPIDSFVNGDVNESKYYKYSDWISPETSGLTLLYEVHVPVPFDGYCLSADGTHVVVHDTQDNLLLYDCKSKR